MRSIAHKEAADMKLAADYRALARDALRRRWKTAVLAGLLASALGANIVNATENITSNANRANQNSNITPGGSLELFSQANGGRLLAESGGPQNGVIVHSDLLAGYLKEHYPQLYLVSSTTKVLTEFEAFRQETAREDFAYVVPDFRLNKAFAQLETLARAEKDKVEFLCNECCWTGCRDRKRCYEVVSRQNLGEDCPDHRCAAPDAAQGYRFSKAMRSPAFIGVEDIKETYLPMGFSNFKIEGRGLGSALVLEFLLYYLVKPEHQLEVREEIYLDNMLDLF